MKDPKPQETRLLELARQGDRVAFESLVRAHQRRVYGLALRMLGSHEEAEDVLQETFLALFNNLGRFRGAARLSTYLYRLAANFSLQRLRARKSSRERQHVPLEQEAERPDPRAFSLERLVDSETRALMNRFLQRLPAAERAAVVLRDVEGLSGAETARVLGISLPSLKSRLRRGREALRLRMLPYIK